MKLLWGGVAEGWVMATQDVWRHPIVIARAIKKNFEVLAENNKIKRVQTAVRADFDIGLKFAKWLGLEEEGISVRMLHAAVCVQCAAVWCAPQSVTSPQNHQSGRHP